jgi:molybdopterin-binding protein
MARFTVRAAAEQLGVAYSTLKRWVYTGRADDPDGRRAPSHRRQRNRSSSGETPAERHRRTPRADSDESIAELSARNRLRGDVDEVRVDGLLAQVRLRVGDQTLTSVITADAVRALKLRRGDDVLTIVKSTELMIARPGTSYRG